MKRSQRHGNYFFACWLPHANIPVPNAFKRWSLRQPLWNTEAAVRDIGKAHQYVRLGNVLTEMGTFDQAAAAYQQALEQEPTNLHALWGALFIGSIDCSAASAVGKT